MNATHLNTEHDHEAVFIGLLWAQHASPKSHRMLGPLFLICASFPSAAQSQRNAQSQSGRPHDP
jgi:hypothetical protein